MAPCRVRKRGRNGAEENAITTQSSAASENIEGNQDLLSLILSRLPVKPVFRFKLVSKNWLAIISNLCLSLPQKPKFLLIQKFTRDDSNVFYFIPLDGIDKQCKPVANKSTIRSLDFIKEKFQALQSCNGLLLCRSPPRLLHWGARNSYYVCNPLTKQFFALPLPQYGAIVCINLAVDNPKSTRYKVVAIISRSSRTFQIAIYCSEAKAWRLVGYTLIYCLATRAWKLAGDTSKAKYLLTLCNGFFWNSGIHWHPTDYDAQTTYFRLDKECIGSIPLPPIQGTNGYRSIKYFGESNGHMHLIDYDISSNLSQCVVFEMESDYSTWFVKYTVDLETVAATFPAFVHFGSYILNVLSVVRKENEEESSFVLQMTNHDVISYNFASRTCRKLLRSKIDFTGGGNVHQYMDTPFSI